MSGPTRQGAAAPARLAEAGPNLSGQPFRNQRPVTRISLLVLGLAVALLLVDVWLYTSYARTRRATASELTEIEASLERERQAMNRAADRLQVSQVGRQNELVRFLNQRIAERTFGWSVLFDRLAVLLPDDVRITNLGPTFEDLEEPADLRTTRNARTPRPGRAADEPSRNRSVNLSINALARDGEAILELLDALFADPAFEDPNLAQESTQATGEIQFTLTVRYLPGAAEALVDGVTAAELADGEVRIGADGTVVPDAADGDDDGGGAIRRTPGGRS